MCKECVATPNPERGETTLDNGSYFLNFKGCKKCGKFSMIKIINRVRKETEEPDYKESVSFTHICSECEHEICTHNYEFSVEGEYQEYEMDCMLCGTGQATHSIDPIDPRKMTEL